MSSLIPKPTFSLMISALNFTSTTLLKSLWLLQKHTSFAKFAPFSKDPCSPQCINLLPPECLQNNLFICFSLCQILKWDKLASSNLGCLLNHLRGGDLGRNTRRYCLLSYHLNGSASPLQDAPVQISRSSLFWSGLLIWRLRSLLLRVMNNTLLFLTTALHKHWLHVSSGGREQGMVPAGCLSAPALVSCLSHQAPGHPLGSVDQCPGPTSLFWVTVQREEGSWLNLKLFSGHVWPLSNYSAMRTLL